MSAPSLPHAVHLPLSRLPRRASHDRARQLAAEPPDLGALDRSGRDLATWRRALAELAKPAQDFRAQRIAREELEKVIAKNAAEILA